MFDLIGKARIRYNRQQGEMEKELFAEWPTDRPTQTPLASPIELWELDEVVFPNRAELLTADVEYHILHVGAVIF